MVYTLYFRQNHSFILNLISGQRKSLFHMIYQSNYSNFKSARNSVLVIVRTVTVINLETPANLVYWIFLIFDSVSVMS
jgi:hypothetical protein